MTQQTQRTFARANLLPTYYGFTKGKLRGNWCNGFWENFLRRSR